MKDKNKIEHKDFWGEFAAGIREREKKSGYIPLLAFIFLVVGMSTKYGGPILLLILTHSIFVMVRCEMEYRRTGEFPYHWRMMKVFYGRNIGLVLIRIVSVLIVALWVSVLILVLTGTFNEVVSSM